MRREQLDFAQQDELFIRQHGANLSQLEPIVSSLQSDPEHYDRLKLIMTKQLFCKKSTAMFVCFI